ncbi:lipocalin family protein [Methylophaga muralis]|uniref:Outer membrane lipoprotein Blc n=1 Tax=Methylophaga muralis TaxID=291169 RepID=A0A1E3GWG9_9GAMM|nr:lipocalin family protein [Methylophaga muralis]ODN68295.1 Outer membrane lipoprotein Blc precursor [Methylophaga muralis]
MRLFTILLLSMVLTACTGTPKGVEPVTGFELERYLGKWYEIARLDHSFERGLTAVTADYSLRDDGNVKVINRGYDQDKTEWKEAEGKAKFVNDTDIAQLKVSFFGPFYGSYIVFGLDKQDYQYAFVAGPNHGYLWLLARTPQVDEAIIERFINEASQRGFNTDDLIFVEHDQAGDD